MTEGSEKYGTLRLTDWLKERYRIHPESWRIVGALALASVLLLLLWQPLGLFGFAATIAVALFFRDPVRYVPTDPNFALAAADGTVLSVTTAMPPPELALPQTQHWRIATFLSVLDVHINRLPVDGSIVDSHYEPGEFRAANDALAGVRNERLALTLERSDGERIAVVQIAGAIARRIIKWVVVGEKCAAGDRYGLIRFGSRVDVWLPITYHVRVSPGQRTIGGETVIAQRAAGGSGDVPAASGAAQDAHGDTLGAGAHTDLSAPDAVPK